MSQKLAQSAGQGGESLWDRALFHGAAAAFLGHRSHQHVIDGKVIFGSASPTWPNAARRRPGRSLRPLSPRPAGSTSWSTMPVSRSPARAPTTPLPTFARARREPRGRVRLLAAGDSELPVTCRQRRHRQIAQACTRSFRSLDISEDAVLTKVWSSLDDAHALSQRSIIDARLSQQYFSVPGYPCFQPPIYGPTQLTP
jgi:hypothetical protein